MGPFLISHNGTLQPQAEALRGRRGSAPGPPSRAGPRGAPFSAGPQGMTAAILSSPRPPPPHALAAALRLQPRAPPPPPPSRARPARRQPRARLCQRAPPSPLPPPLSPADWPSAAPSDSQHVPRAARRRCRRQLQSAAILLKEALALWPMRDGFLGGGAARVSLRGVWRCWGDAARAGEEACGFGVRAAGGVSSGHEPAAVSTARGRGACGVAVRACRGVGLGRRWGPPAAAWWRGAGPTRSGTILRPLGEVYSEGRGRREGCGRSGHMDDRARSPRVAWRCLAAGPAFPRPPRGVGEEAGGRAVCVASGYCGSRPAALGSTQTLQRFSRVRLYRLTSAAIFCLLSVLLRVSFPLWRPPFST